MTITPWSSIERPVVLPRGTRTRSSSRGVQIRAQADLEAIGSLIRSSEVSMAGRCTNTSISCRTDSPVQEQSVDASSLSSSIQFWREAPRIGLTWVAEIEIGERGVVERVAYTSTWRPIYCAAPRRCADPSRMRRRNGRSGHVSGNRLNPR
jgi:hypothetical protein